MSGSKVFSNNIARSHALAQLARQGGLRISRMVHVILPHNQLYSVNLRLL